jgi:hypothetical protein
MYNPDKMGVHMTASIPSNSKQVIVEGLQKIQKLSPHEEGQFVQALKNKSKVKLQLEGGKVLSIRLFDPSFIEKLQSLSDSKIKSELLDQIKNHQVIYVVTNSPDSKEYIATASVAETGLKNKTVTLLNQEELDEITTLAKELAETVLEAEAATTHAEKQATPKAPLPPAAAIAETSTPSTTVTETAPPPSLVVDTALTKGKEKALERSEVEEEHIKKDIKIADEKKALEKKQDIEKREIEHQEKRIESATPSSQSETVT